MIRLVKEISELEKDIMTAHELGRKAFKKEMPCKPYVDKELLTLIGKHNTYKATSPLCKAWTNGWTHENLK